MLARAAGSTGSTLVAGTDGVGIAAPGVAGCKEPTALRDIRLPPWVPEPPPVLVRRR